MSTLAPLIQSFFIDRLAKQRDASAHTISAYKLTFSLLFEFARDRVGKSPSCLDVEDLAAPLIADFLQHLEAERKNSVRTRNARLAAIHSFFSYIAVRVPNHADLVKRVLDIPTKRFDRGIVDFLTRGEIEALLAAPDRQSWIGRRDHALLFVAIQTGLRASELVNLRIDRIVTGKHPCVRCMWKGRKERCTPLTRQAVQILRSWLKERGGAPVDPVFPSCRGDILSLDGLEKIVTRHAASAARICPSLGEKRVTPHVLRHTAAMQLRHARVDLSTIALWLGHESIETTQIYQHAELAGKEEALSRLPPFQNGFRRFRPTDELLAFLKDL
jgi:integrase/recombinase XerD